MSLASAERYQQSLRADDVPCPTCKAKRGQPCLTAAGGPLPHQGVHAPREKSLEQRQKEAATLVAWERGVAGKK